MSLWKWEEVQKLSWKKYLISQFLSAPQFFRPADVELPRKKRLELFAHFCTAVLASLRVQEFSRE